MDAALGRLASPVDERGRPRERRREDVRGVGDVHARRRHDRPRHWAQWDQVALLRDALPKSLPLVLNGDVFSPDDVPRALAATGADALMLARGAMWNPSLFDRGRAALAPASPHTATLTHSSHRVHSQRTHACAKGVDKFTRATR